MNNINYVTCWKTQRTRTVQGFDVFGNIGMVPCASFYREKKVEAENSASQSTNIRSLGQLSFELSKRSQSYTK